MCGVKLVVKMENPTIFPHICPYGGIPHLYLILDPLLWACRGVLTLKHVIASGRVVPFANLRQEHSLPRSMGFRYWQLNHALRMQFLEPIVLESDPIECHLTSRVMGKPLSSLYLCLSLDTKSDRLYQHWHADIPKLMEEDWEDFFLPRKKYKRSSNIHLTEHVQSAPGAVYCQEMDWGW